MAQKSNVLGTRLGFVNFWKTEVFSRFVTNHICRFFSLYIIIKKLLDFCGYLLVPFKAVFSRSLKILLLMQVYRFLTRIWGIKDVSFFRKEYKLARAAQKRLKALRKKMAGGFRKKIT